MVDFLSLNSIADKPKRHRYCFQYLPLILRTMDGLFTAARTKISIERYCTASKYLADNY
jgi:hypothetical protein